MNRRGTISIGPDLRSVIRILDPLKMRYETERDMDAARLAMAQAMRNCETHKARAGVRARSIVEGNR